MARKYSLPTAAKKESMGICFVGNRKGGAGFNGFLGEFSILSTFTRLLPEVPR